MSYVEQTVGYNIMPMSRNEEGLVALTIDRKMSEVCDNQQGIADALQKIVVSVGTQPNAQPNAFVCIESIRPLLDSKCVYTIN